MGKKHFTGNANHEDNNMPRRKTKEEYAAQKAAQLEMQGKSLDIINDVAAYLDDFLQNGKGYRITMHEILSHLNDECGYTIDQTKVISQFNYLMMDLTNARKNPHISGDRLNIRVMYIEERMKTSFKSELHDRARNIIDTYSTLFHWDNEATGDDYNALPEGK